MSHGVGTAALERVCDCSRLVRLRRPSGLRESLQGPGGARTAPLAHSEAGQLEVAAAVLKTPQAPPLGRAWTCSLALPVAARSLAGGWSRLQRAERCKPYGRGIRAPPLTRGCATPIDRCHLTVYLVINTVIGPSGRSRTPECPRWTMTSLSPDDPEAEPVSESSRHWAEQARYDLDTARAMFDAGRHLYPGLFILHSVSSGWLLH